MGKKLISGQKQETIEEGIRVFQPQAQKRYVAVPDDDRLFLLPFFVINHTVGHYRNTHAQTYERGRNVFDEVHSLYGHVKGIEALQQSSSMV